MAERIHDGGREQLRDAEYDRVSEFRAALSLIDEVRISPIELDLEGEEDPTLWASRRFMMLDYRTSPTLYIDKALQTFAGKDQRISFEPRVTRSGKHSNHGVFIGDLGFQNSEGAVREVSVAVKPHTLDGAAQSCLKDYLNNCAVNEMGFYSLQPAGFIIDSPDLAYSMTILDEGLTTLDSIDWSTFYPDTENDPGMENMFSQVARYMAEWHHAGSNGHGDLAPRNIATSAEGNVFFIDWEKSHISRKIPRDAEVRYGFSYMDHTILLESMCRPTHDNFKAGIGVFYGKQGDWWEAYDKLVFAEYKQFRLELAETVTGKGRAQFIRDVHEEIAQLEIELREDTEMYRATCDDMFMQERAVSNGFIRQIGATGMSTERDDI